MIGFAQIYLIIGLVNGLAAGFNFRVRMAEARVVRLRMALAALVPAEVLVSGAFGLFNPLFRFLSETEAIVAVIVGWAILNYGVLRIACRGLGAPKWRDRYWISPRAFCLLMSTLYTVPLVLLAVLIELMGRGYRQ